MRNRLTFLIWGVAGVINIASQNITIVDYVFAWVALMVLLLFKCLEED